VNVGVYMVVSIIVVVIMPGRRIDQTSDARKGTIKKTTTPMDSVRRNTDVIVVLRNGVEIKDPLEAALRFLRAYGSLGPVDRSAPATYGEPDLRLANRGGARISAAQIAAILERRRAIESALRAIPPAASLARARVPWEPLGQLFEAFAGISGVGFSKMTKSLHGKRPALIPILDSVVQSHLAEDDRGAQAPFGERALGLTRGYKRDLDRNRSALGTTRRELARRGHEVTEVRILDLLIWSAEVIGFS
jgi:hypothetical protein